MSTDPLEANTTPDVRATSEYAPLPELPPPPSLWALRDLYLFLAFFLFVAWIASPLLLLAAYTVLRPHVGWHTPTHLLVKDNAFFLVISQALSHVFVLGYVYLLIVVHYRRPFWETLQWRNPRAHQAVRFFLGGILLAIAIRFAPTVLPDRQDFPLERLFSSREAAFAVGAFAVFIAPFMEELIFRGVMFSIFEHHMGLRFAVASTAVLFAGLHVPEYWGAWNHVLLIFIVGLVFSFARGITGSLVPSVILHLAYNATLMSGLLFGPQPLQSLVRP